MGGTCIIEKCPRYINFEKAKLHRFPAKLETFNRWKKFINREELKFHKRGNYRICDLHFDENMKFPDDNNRTNLIYGAYPTLFLNIDNGHCLLERLLRPSSSSFQKQQNAADSAPKNIESREREETKLTQTTEKIEQPQTTEKIEQPQTTEQVEQPQKTENIEPFRLPKKTPRLYIVALTKAEALTNPNYVFNSVKISTKAGPIAMCRLCMNQTDSPTAISESSPKFGKTYNEIAELVLPGINMKLYRDPIICSRCIELLHQSYYLRTIMSTSEGIYKRINTNARNIVIHPRQHNKNNALTDHDYTKEETCDFDREKDDETEEQQSYEIEWGKGPFLCSYCGKFYDQRLMFILHLSKHRLVDKTESFRCEICDIFFHNTNRREHYESHIKPQPGKCPKCLKTFKIKHNCSKLKMLVENKQKISQCEICGKQVKGSIVNHQWSHKKELWAKTCPICDKIFALQYQLNKHLTVHETGEFDCNICGKVMKCKTSLKNHVLIVHENRGKYRCSICDKTFLIRDHLTKHFRGVHILGRARNREKTAKIVT